MSKEIISFEVIDPNYYMDEDVTYAQTDAWFGHVTRDLKMDIIYPQIDEAQLKQRSQLKQKKQFPCIVWICGGAFLQMNKAAHIPYLAALARRGFVVASAEYRLSHEAPFPGALIDIKAAIRYLRAHAERYSIDTEKFGVCGESAGGYLTAMTALIRDKEFEQGEYLEFSSAVQAACPWYMPCDLIKMFRETGIKLPFFNGDINDEKYCRSINPVSYITEQPVPFLLLHGTNDSTVPFEQSEIFYNALLEKKADVRLVAIKDEEHAGPQFFQQPLWDLVAGFFLEKFSG